MRPRFVVPLLLLLATLSACKKEYITEIHSVARDLRLDSAAVTLYPGQSTRVSTLLSSPLNLSVGESLSWESRSPTTATVASDGTIRALAPGYTLVTVYLMQQGVKTSLSASVQVTVLAQPVQQKSVSIAVTPSVATLLVGDTLPTLVTVTRTPSTLTDSVVWQSSSPATATVSRTGVIRAIAPGTANIRAVAVADTTKSATITVTVNARPTSNAYVRSITPAVTQVSLKFNQDTVVAVNVTADAGVTDRSYTCVASNAALVIVTNPATCRFKLIAAYSAAITNVRIIYTATKPGDPSVNNGVVSTFVTVIYSP